MFNIVIFGAPGCGKGTQSDRIADRYGLYHISTGEVLRGHIARDTELGRLANQYISQGHLIPDDLMLDVLAHELDSHPEEVENGVIFDGFPRTIPQAERLTQMMKDRGSDVHAVVGLEVDDNALIDRLIERGRQTGRADDNLDTIKERLKVYHEQTQPLKDYYLKEGKYKTIDGNLSINEVSDNVAKTLDGIKR